MPGPAPPGLTTYDAKDPDTAFPPIEPLLPPEGAPNVLIVLLDDVGFGAASAFGGPCATPTAERLAAGGLGYNRFHTTALCAPTRQAMLTGRNHHSVGMGSITETATSAPGNSSLRPNTKAPLAMTLKLNGYSTAQFGKCHEVPVWQSSPMGPFDAWPSAGGGFETFYGFIGGENNQWEPGALRGHHPGRAARHARGGLPPHRGPRRPRRQLDAACRRRSCPTARSSSTSRPAPRMLPTTFRRSGPRSTAAGSPTAGTSSASARSPAEGTRHHAGRHRADRSPPLIPAWDDMPDELKPVLERQMEVYAGFLEHTDHQVGRLVDTLEDLGVLEDTLIYYIIGDNGASAEGTMNGAFNEMANFNGMAALETTGVHAVEDGRVRLAQLLQPLLRRLGVGDELAVPVDEAGRLALGRHPQRHHRALAERDRRARRAAAVHALHRRGPHDPRGRGPARAGHGQRRAAVADRGHEHALHLRRRGCRERHDLQYFEMFGNRGIYHRGWSAVTKHKTPWLLVDPEARRVR